MKTPTRLPRVLVLFIQSTAEEPLLLNWISLPPAPPLSAVKLLVPGAAGAGGQLLVILIELVINLNLGEAFHGVVITEHF